jgi:hypothetical protein
MDATRKTGRAQGLVASAPIPVWRGRALIGLNSSQLLAGFGAGAANYRTFHTVFHAVFTMLFAFVGTGIAHINTHPAKLIA